jgi:class 3 adenylate cyclase
VPHPEQQFRWVWQLAAPPAALWPLVSNTDRFNRDCGYPPVTQLPRPPEMGSNDRPVRRLRTSVAGVPIEWNEFAFEWVAPERFGVERIYSRGPLARMVVNCVLEPDGSGTRLTYDMRVTPSGVLGRVAAPLTIGRQAGATMARVFRQYDQLAQQGVRHSTLARPPKLLPAASARLAQIAANLVTTQQQPSAIVSQLHDFVRSADDLSVARIRAYALADDWRLDRRETLQTFLHATRAGLLDFSWDTVCPHCRGSKPGTKSLESVRAEAHCDSCGVDFIANFDQTIELTFEPNPAIRAVTRAEYCVGGPQVTPHILAQVRVPAATKTAVRLGVGVGRYRARASGTNVQQTFRIAADGAVSAGIELGRAAPEFTLSMGGELSVFNPANEPSLVTIEHLAWTDQATTAAEVTSLQVFRDLFSREVLRPGERIGVRSLTLVFTDLKDSTQMYRELGDAPAFGRVLTHFEILRAAVATEGGSIVKTMGDAIMAVFPRPIPAVRAVLQAKRWLSHPTEFPLPDGGRIPLESLAPLALKAGLHAGPCLAINQNDRLDYFGTTVNVAARLCGQCTGSDIVLSAAVFGDLEVRAFFASAGAPATRGGVVRLKGLADAAFDIWRVADTDGS